MIVRSSPADASSFPCGLKATEVTDPEWTLSVATSVQVFTSQTRTFPSKSEEQSHFPSGLQVTECTSVLDMKVRSSFPLETSQILTGCDLFMPPEPNSLLSGLNAREQIEPFSPGIVSVFFPVLTSHSLIAPEASPEASVFPFGLKLIAWTPR